MFGHRTLRSLQLHHCMYHILEEMATRQPNRLAINSCFLELCLYRRLSYLELNNYITRLPEYINTYNLHYSPNGLCFQNSPVMIIAILAVWKAGRALVISDPSADTTTECHLTRYWSQYHHTYTTRAGSYFSSVKDLGHRPFASDAVTS